MTNDIDDLLGELEGSKPAAKPEATAKPAKAPAKKAAPAPAKKAAVKTAKAPAKTVTKPVAKAAPAKAMAKPVATRNPANFIVFADGEREALSKRIKQMVRKPTNSRTLAEKLEIHSRKLRRVLYGMERAGTIKLVPGTSRKHGMFAHPV